MKASIKHNTTKTAAIDRVKHALKEAEGQLAQHGASIAQEWKDNVLSFALDGQGQKISGTLTITDESFDIDAKLPLALRLFEGRIQKMIQDAAAQALKA